MQNNTIEPFAQSVRFKAIVLILFFIPPYSQRPYETIETTEVIGHIMSQPLITNIYFFLPIAKLLLLFAAAIIFVNPRRFTRLFLGYYSFILIIVGVFQNMSFTEEYGFVWLSGNTIIILIAATACMYDVIKQKTVFNRDSFEIKRLWVLAPMLLAILMPYAVNEQNIAVPSFELSMLMNEAGVTYYMIIPVIIGVMLLFSKDMHIPTLSIVSFTGLVIGIMNILTWCSFQTPNWWMGVLHLPLVILSFYGLILCRIRQ